MMRTKRQSEKGRKKVLRAGSKGFYRELYKDKPVRVTRESWDSCILEIQSSLRKSFQERNREALEEKDRDIIRIQQQLNVDRIRFGDIARELEFEKRERASLQETFDDVSKKKREIQKILTALLVPWASFLGPRKLRQLIVDSLGAINIDREVSFSVGRSVIIDMMEAMANLTNQDKSSTEELESGRMSPIDKAVKVFTDSVRKTFLGYL